MFFGSGNLVFPLTVGTLAKANFGYASIGFFLTGVLIPFLGLFSVLVRGTSGQDVLMGIGRLPGLVLIFMMLGLLGPFAVCPRCVLVAYGGVQLIFPKLPLALFSLIFCSIGGYILWRRHAFVKIIGAYLTPFLMGGVFLIILFGYVFAEPITQATISPRDSFKEGFLHGYQLMDLIAAFFFSGTALSYLKFIHAGENDKGPLIQSALMACCLGLAILAFVYIGFVSLSAHYAPLLAGVKSEQMLTQIAGQTLGIFAMPITAITVSLACLTTFIVLVKLFADFCHEHFARKKINSHWSLLMTLLITFGVSLLGFSTIAHWLGEVLTFVYPSLIALASASILKDLLKLNSWVVPVVFYSVLCLSAVLNLTGIW